MTISPPQQARSQKTLDRLLNAAQVLLAEKSFSDVTVSNIVAAAGSSAGSFYARFGDKNALLHALHERIADESIAAAESFSHRHGTGALSLNALADQLVPALVKTHQRNRGVFRAALVESLNTPAFSDRALTMVQTVSAVLATTLDHHSTVDRDPSKVLEAGIFTVLAVLDQSLFFWRQPVGLKSSPGHAPEDYSNRLTKLFLAATEPETTQ